MRLIDADEFRELIDGGYDLNFDDVPNTKKELLRMIDDAPTVSPDMAQVLAYECGKDSVQVVRCKDCVFCQKFNEKYYLPKRDTLICANALYTEVHENDYCSWGERRSE